MVRFWKEPEPLREEPALWAEYSDNARTLKRKPLAKQPADKLRPRDWWYCVEVCKFTFRFRSLAHITKFRDYFAAEQLPSQRLPSPRVAKNTGDRLAKALSAALLHFADAVEAD